MHFDLIFIVLSFLFNIFVLSNCENEVLSVVQNDFENHLLFATVSGNLYFYNKYSGEQIWKTKLDQFVKTQNNNGSMLIPNPISGQLYIFQHNSNNRDLFTQLEHSLYEYVRQTPVFMENMLLTGSKNDNWLSLDMSNGKIIRKYRSGSVENCPQYTDDGESRVILHVGVCEYSLVVSDKSSRHILYKVVMNSLSTHAFFDQFIVPGLRLYVSSDSGLIAVRQVGVGGIETDWSGLLDSAVIGVYAVTRQGVLGALNFSTMAHETVRQFVGPQAAQSDRQAVFRKSLFLGHTDDNWYVLKAYVSEATAMRAVARVGLPLIAGGGRYNDTLEMEGPLAGFYEVPVHSNSPHDPPRTHVSPRYWLDFDRSFRNTALVQKNPRGIVGDQLPHLIPQESSLSSVIGLVLLAATFLMTVLILFRLSKQQKRQKSVKEVSSRNNLSNVVRPEDGDSILVGDISYNPKEVLGYGTNGTAVFRGVFHGNERTVAVKRLIKSAQSHYELQFLRQSFDCSNLIKCFYITESREFTFLALELCDCTLEGYVTDHHFRQSCGLERGVAIRQMMTGVVFLHDKGIVHRDLKPRNVLLMREHKVTIRPGTSRDAAPPTYKVVISDFGLSRQSMDQCLSITKTGCGGTSGYMAPELSRDDVKRITTSADIFSCAILFHYVYTDGGHPFGADVLSRQHRIHEGQFVLNEDLISDQLLLYFMRRMLQSDPSDRPSAREILSGPLFWSSVDKLAFLCDISDWVEKADPSLQLSLDGRGREVFPSMWTDGMEAELVDNLQSQRSYQTGRLSHLVRAIRNKRNHFHDLPEAVSRGLFSGSLDGLCAYIDRRFPRLLCTVLDWACRHRGLLGACARLHLPDQPGQDLPVQEGGTGPSEDPREDQDEGDLLEWRRPARKRPSQPKKHRGARPRPVTAS